MNEEKITTSANKKLSPEEIKQINDQCNLIYLLLHIPDADCLGSQADPWIG